MIAFEPRRVQCIPARFSRVPTTTLHPASTTPLEVRDLAPRTADNACGRDCDADIERMNAFSGLVGVVGVSAHGA